MRSLLPTSFAAVFTNEVLLNTKRVAPYALMILFSANAVLWWGWGPAVARGWATNSEFYIQRNLGGFSFILGLPIFTAVIMGDPVIRDFRLGVSPLILLKPVGHASYLLGKFFGNFFVLVCCQSTFIITMFLLQWVPFSGMVTLPVRVVPYFKHFFIVVVISHLVLAAIYFAAGTLTRNAKVVYGLAACFYPVFIGYQILLKTLPTIVGVISDPFGWSAQFGLRADVWSRSADFLNQYVVMYGPAAYANRASMIIISALLLLIVYFRFRIDPQEKGMEHFTKLTLSEAPAQIAYSAPSHGLIDLPGEVSPVRERIPLPKVTSTCGPSATLFKILAAIGVEFRLLRAERGFLVLIPLAIFLSFLSVPFSGIAPEISYSVTSASNTANMLLLFLACVIVFYTGEAMHRDRELKIEPVVWSAPAPNSVLLISKWVAMTLLALSLVVVGSLSTIVTQFLRGHTPIDFAAYLIIDGVVVVPGIIFMTALVVAFNILLRNKYLAYVVAIGTGAGLFYLYNLGYNHWLYNPLLYQLWKYQDLTSARIPGYRLYSLALAAACLALAHLLFERKST
ncbi:MAG TPA: ABC transporter permease [Pyrinomonadaceae bacterium]|nr:ABC transporter permease [Pyrinomonadaceae bacterium]